MTAVAVDLRSARRKALRAERDAIERREYTDRLRLREIHTELEALAEDPEDG